MPGCLPLGIYPWLKDMNCGPVIGAAEQEKEPAMTMQENFEADCKRREALVHQQAVFDEGYAAGQKVGRAEERLACAQTAYRIANECIAPINVEQQASQFKALSCQNQSNGAMKVYEAIVNRSKA